MFPFLIIYVRPECNFGTWIYDEKNLQSCGIIHVIRSVLGEKLVCLQRFAKSSNFYADETYVNTIFEGKYLLETIKHFCHFIIRKTLLLLLLLYVVIHMLYICTYL